jgi:hypothetical protein
MADNMYHVYVWFLYHRFSVDFIIGNLNYMPGGPCALVYTYRIGKV